MCRRWALHAPDLVKHQSICATCVPYTGKTVGHYLDSGADEVRNDVIWRRTGGSVIKGLFAFWGVGVVLAWGRGLPDD